MFRLGNRVRHYIGRVPRCQFLHGFKKDKYTKWMFTYREADIILLRYSFLRRFCALCGQSATAHSLGRAPFFFLNSDFSMYTWVKHEK